MPPFLPDNDAVRRDIAAQWTAWTRLDATLGALLGEVPLDDALVVLFSDNGIPFPSGKTNLAFEQGQREPLLISSPSQKTRGRRSDKVVGALDFFPTILDWVGLGYPNATAGGAPAALSGASLLPLLDGEGDASWRDSAFGSHQFHSLFCYYPSRSLVTSQFRLVHNIAYDLKYRGGAETPLESGAEA